jgi:hypothetical protein
VAACTVVFEGLGVSLRVCWSVGVPLWLAIRLAVRVVDAVELGSFPAVENMAIVALDFSARVELSVFVIVGPGVVVGPAVTGVSRLFSASEVLIAA